MIFTELSVTSECTARLSLNDRNEYRCGHIGSPIKVRDAPDSGET